MRLAFNCNQEQYDAWFAFHLARVDDETFWFVDLNDMVMVFAAARVIASNHPEKLEDFARLAPEAIEKAGKELGMFMGIGALCKDLGIDPQEGHDAMIGL